METNSPQTCQWPAIVGHGRFQGPSGAGVFGPPRLLVDRIVFLPDFGDERSDAADDAATAGAGWIRDAQVIIDAALSAVARGARGAHMDSSATRSVHEQFLPRVRPALEKADWRSDWQREEIYVRAFARALGRHAAILAALDRRTVITGHDIDAAAMKMRGYMPIAGRWCPP